MPRTPEGLHHWGWLILGLVAVVTVIRLTRYHTLATFNGGAIVVTADRWTGRACLTNVVPPGAGDPADTCVALMRSR